jgi:hypothetical protein
MPWLEVVINVNRFEKWFVERVIANEVKQDWDHTKKITGLYKMINGACQREFYEDNKPTLNGFLRERFEEAL